MTAFLAFTALLVVTPGSTTAVVVRNVLERGRPGGLGAATGAAIGNATWGLLSALGLAALLARTPLVYTLLRYGGAGYLAYLGVRGLLGAWGPRPAIAPGALEPRGTAGVAGSARHGARQGLMTNLLHPANATFYLTVIPTFVAAGRLYPVRFMGYGAIHVAMAFACHCAWVFALDAMRAFWRRPGARCVLETLTGLALLGLAWRVGS